MISTSFLRPCNPVGIAIISKTSVISTRQPRTGSNGAPLIPLGDSERTPHLFFNRQQIAASCGLSFVSKENAQMRLTLIAALSLLAISATLIAESEAGQ